MVLPRSQPDVEAIRDAVREVVRELLPEIATAAADVAGGGAGDRYLSVSKAARVADADPSTVPRWSRSGALTGYRTGPRGELRVSERELREMLARNARPRSEVSAPEIAAEARRILGSARVRTR